MPEAEQGMNVARIASLRAGVPVESAAVTINRFCSSGLQAIAFAAERIACGSARTIVAGGTESMSLIPMGGHKIAPNPELMRGYPDVYLSTGLVAENHAAKSRISREEQDAFALRSHERAVAALDGGRFADETTPVTVRAVGGNGRAPRVTERTLAADEGPRRDTSAEALAGLRPAFHARGSVTAGNSSQMSDGAAAVVVTSAERAAAAGLAPLGRFVAFTTAGGAARAVRPRPRAGHPQGPEAGRPDARRHGPRGAQRGLRRAGAGLPQGAADRPGPAERQWRRDCTGASPRMHRRQADGDAAARAAPPAGSLRPGHDVRRRRHGRRGHLRASVREMTTTTITTARRGGAWLLDDVPPAESFTPERMTEEQRLIDQTTREFVANEVVAQNDQLETKDWDLARRLLRRCGELGILGTDVPEAYGGIGLDKVSAAIIAGRLGQSGSFSTTFGAQTGLAILPIRMFGSADQKRRYLPKLLTGEWVGAYCLSESGSGSDALGARTRAVRRPDGSFVLNGEKMWISNGGFADLYVVFAKVDGEHFTAFLVERGFEGVSSGAEGAQDGPRRLVDHPGHPAGRARAGGEPAGRESARATRWPSTC